MVLLVDSEYQFVNEVCFRGARKIITIINILIYCHMNTAGLYTTRLFFPPPAGAGSDGENIISVTEPRVA